MINSDIAKTPTRNNSDMLNAKRGMLVIADTETHTGRWGGFVAESAVVIAEIKLNGSASAATLNSYSTANRAASTLYLFAEDVVLTSIKLTSGTLALIKE